MSDSLPTQPMIFATRASALARWQTQYVIQALQAAWPGLVCQEQTISTTGDRVLDQPLAALGAATGGKGLFTQKLEAELLAGRVQAAVHSLKDLPVENTPGLVLGCIPVRGAANDVLISAGGKPLEYLPFGARLGTSSLRRAAQLLRARPDLRIEALRGNVDTRLRKALAGEYDAIVLAQAGLERLGLAQHITQSLAVTLLLPAPGQGALAVQCRADDSTSLRLLAAIEHPATRQAVSAERAFLAALGGGCATPVAAYAQSTPAGALHLHARVLSPDGRRMIEVMGEEGGEALAEAALRRGAGKLLGREG